MHKSQISLSVALFALIVWAIHNFDVNSSCYDILEVGKPLHGPILLDKCKGRTWTLVHDEDVTYEYDELGNVINSSKFRTLSWARVRRSGGHLSFGDIEE